MSGPEQIVRCSAGGLSHRRSIGSRVPFARSRVLGLLLISMALLLVTTGMRTFVNGLMVQRVEKRDELTQRIGSLSTRVHVYNTAIASYLTGPYQKIRNTRKADIRIRWMGLLEDQLRSNRLGTTEYSFLPPEPVILDLLSSQQQFDLLEHTLVITGNEPHAGNLIDLLDDLLGGNFGWVESRGCTLSRAESPKHSVRFRCQLSFYSVTIPGEKAEREFHVQDDGYQL